jgi:hypothetical protein
MKLLAAVLFTLSAQGAAMADSSSIVLALPSEAPRCVVRLNHFPVSTRFASRYRGKTAGITHYVEVDPYYLRPGNNVVTSDCALSIASMPLPEDDQATVLAAVAPKTEVTFTLPASRRSWAWMRGAAPPSDLVTSLYEAYAKLHAQLAALHQAPAQRDAFEKVLARSTDEHLQAQLLRVRPSRHIKHLLKLAAEHGDRKPDTLRPSALPPIGVLAFEPLGGNLAHLTANGSSILRYAGGRHDAPDDLGPTDVAFDVWFRWEGKGWSVDAIQQTYDNPRSVYSFKE